jgi:phosphohistidine swiveling domain-containing protein
MKWLCHYTPIKGMFDFNKIRISFEAELAELKPLLRNAYQSIHVYQLHRNTENEIKMREAITDTATILNLFIPHIPGSKGRYIQALKRQQEMSSFDLIVCFDQAIYELHLWTMLKELSIKRGVWSHGQQPWSKELRILLNERQQIDKDNSIVNVNKEELFKVSGTPACRGNAEGPAIIVLNKDDFHRVKSGSILITTMTTPDFIEIANLITGLVTDRGGVVCHAAILAREFNIPCIVGCYDATKTIKDGEIIRMDAISGVVMGV